MFVIPAADFIVLAVDLLVLGDDFGAFLVGFVGAVDGHAVGFCFEQHPGSLERALHPFEFPAGLRLDEHMAGLLAAGSGRVSRRGKVQVQRLVTQHPAEPGAAVEADVDFSGFLDHDLESPRLELFLRPGFGFGECGGADEPSADAVGQEVGVHHHLVVRGPGLDDFLDDFVLRISAERAAQGHQGHQCEGADSLHNSGINILPTNI